MLKSKSDILFNKNKFGIFIHWGLYSIPAGRWNGIDYPYIGEWIMKRAKIPVKEYEKLAEQFNPTNFDADRLVQLVKKSKAMYLVFTAKHHDGFAMYHSKVSPYNIVDSTPFKRDPLREIAESCRRHGIKFGIYYSHDQDWHDPNGTGNDWDYLPDEKKNFSKYLEEKAEPQIRELFSNYGPISLVWFDTPFCISKSQSQRIISLVKQLQPDCLINGRIGHGLGDYVQQSDNEIPSFIMDDYWEVPATMNDTWGYKHNDNNWKSVKSLTLSLIDIISKGGNYLLNIGPDATGKIPKQSKQRLLVLGKWLEKNSEAIFGCKPNPFKYEFSWGSCTKSGNKLYLHIYENFKKEVGFYGLRNKVKKASLLGDNSTGHIKLIQNKVSNHDFYYTKISLGNYLSDKEVSVIALELEGDVDIDEQILPHSDGSIRLEAFMASRDSTNKSQKEKKIEIDNRGHIKNWLDTNEFLKWKFRVLNRGIYKLLAYTATYREDGDPATPLHWDGGHSISIELAGKKIESEIVNDGKIYFLRDKYFPYIVTNLGITNFAEPGEYELKMRLNRISKDTKSGLMLRSVELVPQEKIIKSSNVHRHKINIKEKELFINKDHTLV